MPRKVTQEDEAETYREAAREHIVAAQEMYLTGRYVLAHYLSGLAVECIFRAYLYRISPVFSGRHDLRILYNDAQFGAIVPPEDEEQVSIALLEVTRRWSNSHRYRSEAALRLFLLRANLGRTGKFVRESSRKIVNAAATIVEIGVLQWNV